MSMLAGELPVSRHLFAKAHGAAAPERASRHLEARSYEGRRAIPQRISAMLPHVVAHRPALPQRLPSSTNAGGKT
ncbi:hypothetical protein, partial [Xanthomonas perforans]|uniref:hypothetical protein n=2 Tax=Xanthomonas perforans TaxID=442694 RepID=UPI0010256A4A